MQQSLKVESFSSDHATLPVLLGRVSTELGTLASGVDDLQDTLGPVLSRAAQERPQTIVHLQKLDSLAQTLASLSVFMQSLGQSSIGARLVHVAPLVDRLTLSDLADRLSGRAAVDPADEDFELF